ncbi:D-aspartate ligase [Promicromonospora umidemergens]|uniref:Carboxylate--amine ligase n=1 Tax=Promicromonospora umidemergens TaxID=629679 RepID=A0ABP8WJC7_9MICO|nr:carboxylate--amine ligase [Promicromonospora umidemergens]MCP2283874.1 D-aspartate ligase [Promicromonospora umidemergens]
MRNHAAVHPVILGGDAGAYSLARAFHERYGVRSTVVSIRPTPNIAHSTIIRNVVEPRLDDPAVMVELIRRVAAAAPGPVIALTCVDWYVRALAAHRELLADVAVVPYAPVGLLDRVMDKRRFSELCHEIGVPHPRTEVRDGGEPVGDLDLRFPVIAKPGDNTAWHRVSFRGKAKVHLVQDRAELAALLDAAGDAGYRRPMIVQEYVPGDDSQMRIMTTYSDRAGTVRMAWGGRVLLEEHTPGTLGNPAAILTGRLGQVEADARRLVEHLGWTGFANFDVKVDPRTGVGHFLELNPRTGRSNYYLTASGLNPAAFWMADHLTGRWPLMEPLEVLYRIVPSFLLDRYVHDESVRAAVRRARVVHPLKYGRDLSPRRDAWVRLAELNQVRKFAQHHPLQEQGGVTGRSGAVEPLPSGERDVA